MKIAIATAGRFHVLDLARELACQGHEVRFYSYVPVSRALLFGLRRENCVSLLPLVLPLVALLRLAPKALQGAANALLARVLDWIVAWRLERCDVFIGMSGIYLLAPRVARSRFGATVIAERGSRHIDSQEEILSDLRAQGIPVERIPRFFKQRELQIYRESDRIAIPSLHVEKSFLDRGIPPQRLFRNPYGVNLSQFYPTKAPPSHKPTALFVGTWSYRKGVDQLVRAWHNLAGIRLLHVGPVGDASLPREAWFEHVGPVDQAELVRYYAQAHLFVHASREEGLSMVIAQALACGLPVVCTDRTGGEDLRHLLVDQSAMIIVPSDDAAALARAIKMLLPKALASTGLRDLLGARRAQLSWEAYGRRYHDELTRIGSRPLAREEVT